MMQVNCILSTVLQRLHPFAVGMVKQPTSETSEFTMSSEDFPALPGTASTEGPSPGSSVVSSSDKSTNQTSEQNNSQQDMVNSRLVLNNDKALALKRGIQTSSDGELQFCILVLILSVSPLNI